MKNLLNFALIALIALTAFTSIGCCKDDSDEPPVIVIPPQTPPDNPIDSTCELSFTTANGEPAYRLWCGAQFDIRFHKFRNSVKSCGNVNFPLPVEYNKYQDSLIYFINGKTTDPIVWTEPLWEDAFKRLAWAVMNDHPEIRAMSFVIIFENDYLVRIAFYDMIHDNTYTLLQSNRLRLQRPVGDNDCWSAR